MIHNKNLIQNISELYPPLSWARFYAVLRTKLFLRRFRTIESHIPPNSRIIDVGCGYGLTAHLFSFLRPDTPVVGIDTNKHRITNALQSINNRKNITFVSADAREYPFRENDTVVFIDVLHHIPYKDHHELLTRIHQEIKNKGTLLIADVEKRPRWKYIIPYLSDVLLYPLSTRCQNYSREDMLQLLKETGWEKTSIHSTADGTPMSSVLYKSTSH